MESGNFRQFLIRKGLKASTVRVHEYALKRILEAAGSDSLTSINNFLLLAPNKGLSNKYINHLVCALRLYGQMNNREDLISLPFYKEKEYIKSVMSDTEIQSFLNLSPPANGNKLKWETWTLFFSIMAYTGMRPGEVAHLTVDNCDFGQNVFVIEDSKTNTPRLVPIAQALMEPVNKRLKTIKSGYIFPSINGGNHNETGQVVDSVDWHYNFKYRINRLGIARKNLTPYSLRHSWITTMLSDDSVKLFDVKRVVGHKQTATTEHYYAYTMKNLQRTVNKHPLARKFSEPRLIIKSLKDAIEAFSLEDDSRLEVQINTLGADELYLKVKVKSVV